MSALHVPLSNGGLRAGGWALALMLLAPASAAQARLRPPAQAECARDLITAYAGAVRRYERNAERTRLQILTDEQTRETVLIQHAQAATPMRWYLMEGRAFEASDWARIEQSPGKLRPGMRVVAWVCSDGHQPLIDWQPPQQP